MPHKHPRQKTLRSPVSCTLLCHGVLCIFLTTPRSYAAVAFYFGQYEKLLRYAKLATSCVVAQILMRALQDAEPLRSHELDSI